MVTPGASRGTSIMEWRLWSSPPAPLVTPSMMKTLHSGRQAPLMYHLWPLMTYSSPSRTKVVLMFVASLLATPGSVIAYALRMVPSSNGSSHCFFCSSVPYFSNTSMLPVSGAVQFMATLHIGKAPKISQMGAYSNTLSLPTSGRKKLYKPRDFAFCLNSISIGGPGAQTGCFAYCGSSPGIDSRVACILRISSPLCFLQIGSAGMMSSLMKSMIFFRTSKKF
mmetsp:Transcript_120274/g.218577  ORF Transcript_120274/g.218577 Transcript_120274/m.218577 type:complete len:223 (+) Transcript_120274:791-1459(+)